MHTLQSTKYFLVNYITDFGNFFSFKIILLYLAFLVSFVSIPFFIVFVFLLFFCLCLFHVLILSILILSIFKRILFFWVYLFI
jgi:hypothetical protein